jgi:hypothetical protein
MKIAKLRGPLGAVVIGAALATGSSAVADEGGRHYRPAPHHQVTDGDQMPYRPAPHHPQPGEVTIPYGLVADPPPAASSGGGIDWDDAVIGGAALAVLAATAGVLARRRPRPRTANQEEAVEAVGLRE